MLKRHPLIAFFTLSYAITWPGWWLEAKISSISWLGSFAGYFGPAIAALLVAATTGGKEGLEEVLASLFQWRVPFKWVLVAAFLPAGSVLVVVAILALTGNAVPGLAAGRWVDILPRLALGLVLGSLYGTFVVAGEELGWRGYALPELLKRHNALVASVIVGVFWGLWHLPLGFLYPLPGLTIVDRVLYGLGIDCASVMYTWIFRHTKGSVLIACLFHSVYDVAVVVAGQMPGLPFSFRVHMLVLAAIAVLIVIIAGPELLSGEPAPGEDQV